MRIVSLTAAASEIVSALGAGSWLVGRSHECDFPEEVTRLPACTRPTFDTVLPSRQIDSEVRRRLAAGEPLYEVDYELIESLRPDLILAQAHCEVCAVTPADVSRAAAGARHSAVETKVVALKAADVAGVLADIRAIASAIGREPAGQVLIETLKRRLDNAGARLPATPTVVAIEWIEPIFTMGNWGPELVVAAGGRPLLCTPGQYSRVVEWSEIQVADPDVLVVAPCGFTLGRAQREAKALESLPGWRQLRAVQTGRAFVADGNRYFNRSGPSIADTAELIAHVLRGDSLDGVSAQAARL